MVKSRTLLVASLALIAFAGNSLLTRLALAAHQIDAASFTSLRLGAGALTLLGLTTWQAGRLMVIRGTRPAAALALFGYAAPFSFAYLRIGAAVGALVLFGVVQLSMIAYALFRGERPSPLTWTGMLLALAGLLLLTAPAAARPDPWGVAWMAVAGASWAVYTLIGRTATDPLAANARSFLWSSPLALAVSCATYTSATATPSGIACALTSGAVTSGIGYALWYRALPDMSVTQAAIAQLTVPVIAALGGVAFLGEHLSARLVASGACVLGGVGLVLFGRTRQRSA